MQSPLAFGHLRLSASRAGGTVRQGLTQNLHKVANNMRFPIPPWGRVPHLASHALGLALRQLPGDWQRRHGHGVYLAETSVDLSRFRGTCYRPELHLPAHDLLQAYFDRWQIEVNHRDDKQQIGIADPQVWNDTSVDRQPECLTARALLQSAIVAPPTARAYAAPHVVRPAFAKTARRPRPAPAFAKPCRAEACLALLSRKAIWPTEWLVSSRNRW